MKNVKWQGERTGTGLSDGEASPENKIETAPPISLFTTGICVAVWNAPCNSYIGATRLALFLQSCLLPV